MMKAYPKYKDSGVPWLEHVPAHWEFKRSKSVFRTIDVRSAEGQEELLSVSEKNGVALRKNTNVTMFQAASYAGYKLCWPNDLVINSLWAWMTGLGFSKYHGIISTAYSVFRIWNQGKFDSDYGNYLLRSKTYNWEFRVRSKGIWRSRYQLADDSFLSMPLLIPPLNEQQQISRYLDWQTSKINKFIKAKKRLIALLKEQKQNVINQAVTRGLDPKVKFKPSGVEWIGDIPDHWEAIKLRNLLKPVSSRNRPDLPLLSVVREKGVIVRDVDDLEGNHNFIPDDLSNYRVVLKGQFAMNKMKAWQGSYGVSDFDGIVSPAYFVFEMLGKVQPEFFHLAIRSKTYVPFFIKASDGVRIGQWDLSIPRMKEIPFFIPSPEEQGEIVGFVREQHSAIDQTITRAEREIELMREYRTRLISDVVTGQVDVRNVKCEGGSLNEDEFEDIEEVEEEIELPEGGEDDE